MSTSPSTLERGYIIYRNMVYPQGIHHSQDSECKQAYFAGAKICFEVMARIGKADVSVEAGTIICQLLEDDINNYFKKLLVLKKAQEEN